MIWLLESIQDPTKVSIFCGLYIIGYYVVSAFCIRAEQKDLTDSVFKKNKPIDIITSVLWFFMAVALTWSLIEVCIIKEISLGFLVLYYFFFIFLFAFCYGLLEWHFPGVLEGVDSSTWEAEFQYLAISVQTQTTLGYTRARPAKIATESIAYIQALLGLLFCIIFIAKAVSLLKTG